MESLFPTIAALDLGNIPSHPVISSGDADVNEIGENKSFAQSHNGYTNICGVCGCKAPLKCSRCHAGRYNLLASTSSFSGGGGTLILKFVSLMEQDSNSSK